MFEPSRALYLLPGALWGVAVGCQAPPPSAPPAPPPLASSQASESGFPIPGRWEGYVENHHFASGADSVVLEIRRAQPQAVEGTVWFGSAAPSPVPSAWAPGPATASTAPSGVASVGPGLAAGIPPEPRRPPGIDPWWPTPVHLEGYGYEIVSGSFDGSRLQLELDLRQPLRPLCASYPAHQHASRLCTPEPPGSPPPGSPGVARGSSSPEPPRTCRDVVGHSCLPFELDRAQIEAGDTCNYTLAGEREARPIDCRQLALCSRRVCRCSPAGCRPEAHADTLDMVLTPTRGDGSWAGKNLRLRPVIR